MILKEMQDVVVEIGRELLTIRQEGTLELVRKEGYADIQSRGDRFSEQTFAAELQRRFPEVGFDGEEQVCNRQGDGRFCVRYDSIDATISYVSGRDNFSISAGLEDGGGPLAEALIHFPAQAKTVYAKRGEGVVIIGKENSKVIPHPRLGASLMLSTIALGFDFSASNRSREAKLHLIPLLEKVLYPYIMGSVTGSVLDLLENRIQAYYHPKVTRYDLAGSLVACREAGFSFALPGGVVDLTRPHQSVIIARTRELLEEIRQLSRLSVAFCG